MFEYYNYENEFWKKKKAKQKYLIKMANAHKITKTTAN